MIHFRVLDAETTGPNSTPNDVVCELASVDLNWDAESKTGQPMAPRSELIQIGIPMPPDAQGIHHISHAELEAKGKTLQKVWDGVVSPYPYPNMIFVAHNAEYEFGTVRDVDGKLLKDYLDPAVQIVCTLKAAYRLWPDAPNHKNQTLRYFLNLQIPDKMAGGLPHRALPDAVVTMLILQECLKLADVGQLIQWTKEPRLLPTCPIGKKQGWAGKKWSEIDVGFLQWMLDQPDMESDLKWNAKHELDRRERARHTIGREGYMSVVPKVIAMAKSTFDLRQWFKDEMATRVSVGIVEGTPEYAEIVKLCKEQSTKLGDAPAKPAEPAALPPPVTPPSPGASDEPADDDVPDADNDPGETDDDTRAAA